MSISHVFIVRQAQFSRSTGQRITKRGTWPTRLLATVWWLFLSLLNVSQVHAASTPGTWAAFGGLSNGCNGQILSSDVLANGNIIVGGSFSECSGTAANNIAMWNGSTWTTLGTGVNGPVNALKVVGSDVFVGGTFSLAGGNAARRIARWNGSAWSAMGTGVDSGVVSEVFAITAIGSDVYVGGRFTAMNGVPANNIARWNNGVWSALGSGASNGVDDEVRALGVRGAELIVGGTFVNAGALVANRIVRWDGANWLPLPRPFGGGFTNGLSGNVFAIAVNGNDIYAGGNFSAVSGLLAYSVAKWNGSWSTLDTGLRGDIGALVYVARLAFWGSELCATGEFSFAGTVSANGLACWNGSAWRALGTVSAPLLKGKTLAVNGADLYVGGPFVQLAGVAANNIGRFNGSNVFAVGAGSGNGVNGGVFSSAVYGTDLIIGGKFTQAGSTNVGAIARLSGNTWLPVGSGLAYAFDNASVYDVKVMGGNLYACGLFTSAGGVPANNIARWDGSSWSALGSGFNFAANQMAVSGSDLYVVGEFTEAGGIPARGVARWNGSSWSALAEGVSGSPYAVAVSGSNVYVGGRMPGAGTISVNNIARWNGSSWNAMGDGLGSTILFNAVYTIAVNGSQIYAGGDFGTSGSVAAVHIAQWNGSSWSGVGGGVGLVSEPTDGVTDIQIDGTAVYAGGAFQTAGGQPANNIARWDGSRWLSLGSGTSDGVKGPVSSQTLRNGQLFVGGFFDQAGGKVSSNFASWTPVPGALFVDGFE
jgi:trimeric autotransporter adhesin